MMHYHHKGAESMASRRTHPTSIRISKDQRRFLKQMARAQRHGCIATVIKRLIDREMHGAAA